MNVATVWFSCHHPAQDEVGRAYQALIDKLGQTPSWLVLQSSMTCPIADILQQLRQIAPAVPIHGSSSCLGQMTESGFHVSEHGTIGLFGVADSEGCYGVGAAMLQQDPGSAAVQATKLALQHAGMEGSVPALIWLTSAPGMEEEIIAGIESFLGAPVPIIGGSSADNRVAGEWFQIANGELYHQAVVVSVLFPSTELLYYFHSGYEPTQYHGVITKAEGRILYEIDGKPAAEVYNQWTAGLLDSLSSSSTNILFRSTFHPLGRIVGHIKKIPYFQLSHPNEIVENQGISLFSQVHQGETIFLMTGTSESLLTRAGRVARNAMISYSKTIEQIVGGLVIYCAGCMLSIQPRMNEVVSSIRHAIPKKPFLGAFTFGEQGCFIGGENRHGNLMIAVLLFSR